MRIIKLEIDIADLKGDVRTLHTNKSLLLHTFAKLQAPYGYHMGKSLAGCKSLSSSIKRKKEVSVGESGEKTANMTKFEPIELPAGLSDK